MSNQNRIQYKIEIKERLRLFSLKILEFSKEMPKSTSGRVINYQLTKSGTSMYANYRAALRGRSRAEFFSKLSIAVEEADETEMWLELAIASNLVVNPAAKELHDESLQLIKILSNLRKRLN